MNVLLSLKSLRYLDTILHDSRNVVRQRTSVLNLYIGCDAHEETDDSS